MILPTKHTNLSESILGLSGFLLSFLKVRSYSIDDLWAELESCNATSDTLFASHTFDNLVLSIDLLFMIGAVTMDTNGNICLI